MLFSTTLATAWLALAASADPFVISNTQLPPYEFAGQRLNDRSLSEHQNAIASDASRTQTHSNAPRGAVKHNAAQLEIPDSLNMDHAITRVQPKEPEQVMFQGTHPEAYRQPGVPHGARVTVHPKPNRIQLRPDATTPTQASAITVFVDGRPTQVPSNPTVSKFQSNLRQVLHDFNLSEEQIDGVILKLGMMADSNGLPGETLASGAKLPWWLPSKPSTRDNYSKEDMRQFVDFVSDELHRVERNLTDNLHGVRTLENDLKDIDSGLQEEKEGKAVKPAAATAVYMSVGMIMAAFAVLL